MRLSLNQRIAILLHEGITGVQGKTGLSILRYSESPIVAIIDRETVGKSLVELTGIQRDVPIVASVTAALQYKPEVLVIGIASFLCGRPCRLLSTLVVNQFSFIPPSASCGSHRGRGVVTGVLVAGVLGVACSVWHVLVPSHAFTPPLAVPGCPT